MVLCEPLQLLFHMANVCREVNMSVEVNLIMVYSSKDVYTRSEGDQLIVKDQIVEYILVCMVIIIIQSICWIGGVI